MKECKKVKLLCHKKLFKKNKDQNLLLKLLKNHHQVLVGVEVEIKIMKKKRRNIKSIKIIKIIKIIENIKIRKKKIMINILKRKLKEKNLKVLKFKFMKLIKRDKKD